MKQHSFQTNAEVLEYRNFFSRGYLYTSDDSVKAPSGWRKYSLPIGSLFVCPLLLVAADQNESSTVIILGSAYSSVFNIAESSEAAKYILANSKDQDTLDRVITYLSGRYVVFMVTKSSLQIYGDPMASMPTYWMVSGENLYASSHSALVSNAVGGLTSESKNWVMTNPTYVNPGGKTLPALIEPFDELKIVFANSRLEWLGADITRHVRFYPHRENPTRSGVEAINQFREDVSFNLSRILEDAKIPIVTLTAGMDSRALVNVGLDQLLDAGTISMTYHFFERNAPSTYADLIAANKLSLEFGFRHLIVPVVQLEAGTDLARLYTTTFPSWSRFPSLAGSLYSEIPYGSTVIFGIGGEIGTGFYTGRDARSISSRVLAKKYSYSKFSEDPRLVEEFEKYIAFTDFHEEKLHGFDFYDIFYWEHRLSKWAAVGYSEYDLSSTVAIPMNSRIAIEALLAGSYEERASKYLYKALY